MGLRRGLAAMRAAAAEGKSRGSGGKFKPYPLRFNAGETRIMRLFGDFEDEESEDSAPIIYGVHFVKRLGGREQYQNCGANAGQPCVFCDMAKSSKGISTSDRGAFFVYNTQPIHKLKEKVKVLRADVVRAPGKKYEAADYQETYNPPCTSGKRPCKYCEAGEERTMDGYRPWELALSHAEVLLSKIPEIREFCRNCSAENKSHEGTLRVSKYLCGNRKCRKPVRFDADAGEATAKCKACSKVYAPVEELECENCENPERALVQDFLWKITRTGDSTNTTYSFEPVTPPVPLTDAELEEMKKERELADLESLTKPHPPGQQAKLLNVPNEYGSHDRKTGHGAATDDEDEDDDTALEDSEPIPFGKKPKKQPAYDEDDEEVPSTARSAPATPKGKTLGKPLGKPSVALKATLAGKATGIATKPAGKLLGASNPFRRKG